jgi:hypothetical protein
MLEGALTWNINQRKSVDCHVVLLEDLLVLFQKQDDKLVLRQQSTQLVAGKEDSRYQFSPLLKLENVLHTNSKATGKYTVICKCVSPRICNCCVEIYETNVFELFL